MEPANADFQNAGNAAGAPELELVAEPAAEPAPAPEPEPARVFANDGIFGNRQSKGRLLRSLAAGKRDPRGKMREPLLWEKVRRAIDYSYRLPDCWLNGLNRTERTRQLLLATAFALLSNSNGSLTFEQLRRQLPAAVRPDELLYVLRTVPLFAALPPEGAEEEVAGEERFSIDAILVISCYEETYGVLDENMAQLIDAIEGLPGKLLTVMEGAKMLPAGYARAEQLDDGTLARAVMLGYVVRYGYPNRQVYVPSPRKELLVRNGRHGSLEEAFENERKQAAAALAAEQERFDAEPANDAAERYHQQVTEQYERTCLEKPDLLGLCCRALYESGGGFTDAELAEYVTNIQQLPCTPERVDFLRENCLQADDDIAAVEGPAGELRYFLAFQTGIDGGFLCDTIARANMLVAQSAWISAQMEAFACPSEAVTALAQQQAWLAGAIQAGSYSGRKQKREMQASLAQVESQLAEAQRMEGSARQQQFALLQAQLEQKQMELAQATADREAEKWRFRLA